MSALAGQPMLVTEWVRSWMEIVHVIRHFNSRDSLNRKCAVPGLTRDSTDIADRFGLMKAGINPVFFAHLVAISETALAIALILGVFSNMAFLGGSLLSLVIWSTAEGFGGPYGAGSKDIGAAVIYVLVFALLFLSRAGLELGLDRLLALRLKGWAFLAPGQPRSS
jgi:uncharacterized membrane protein YphA (DoxX/SURF4 family)